MRVISKDGQPDLPNLKNSWSRPVGKSAYIVLQFVVYTIIMLKDSKAFSSFSTKDLEKAKKFYGETLGLKASIDKEMDLLMLDLPGGGKVMIYPKENHKAAIYTVLNFPVENVEKTVDELVKKGIKMELYEGFDQDEKGISRSMGIEIAWFTDPADNIISVMEEK